MKRAEIIAEVSKCVSVERNSAYGEPEEHFKSVASFWNVYLSSRGIIKDELLNPTDVSILMGLLKIARVATGEAKLDNFIDLAGYAVCGGEVSSKNE